jgi:transcriptional regulator with XRE-family HTH domain
MTPTEIRERREELNLTRQDLARRTETIKVGRLAAIETGHGQPMTETEHDLLAKALGEGRSATPKPVFAGQVRLVDVKEWSGLTAGDPCRVRGIAGARFRFLRYVEQANGHVYVEVIGGRGRGKNAVHNLRCVTPDRLLDLKGRLVQQVWTAANPDEVPVVEVQNIKDIQDTPEEDEDDDLDSAVLG